MKFKKKIEILPFENLGIGTFIKDKEFCNQDILKTITARSFKLCHLIHVEYDK